MNERYELTLERIESMLQEDTVAEVYRDYFRTVARFILKVNRIQDREAFTLEEWQAENQELYADILDENYRTSYANPAYAVSVFGEEIGQLLSFLYTEIRAEIAYAYEGRLSYLTICNELFIEVYNSFEDEETPNYRSLKEIIYWFASDYCDVFVADWVDEKLNPKHTFATDIIMNADWNDLRYLYQYGEYISQNECRLAAYLNSVSEEDIKETASIYVEGFREACEEIEIDLSQKSVIQIQYPIGAERVVREVIREFEELGLKASICRNAVSALTKESKKNGYYGGSASLAYEADHRYDQAIFLNKKWIERKLDVMKNAYEQDIEAAAKFAGCVLVENTEEPVVAEPKTEAIRLNDKQKDLEELYFDKTEQLTNKYLLKELNIAVVDIV